MTQYSASTVSPSPWLYAVVVVIPYLSIVAFALFLNRGL